MFFFFFFFSWGTPFITPLVFRLKLSRRANATMTDVDLADSSSPFVIQTPPSARPPPILSRQPTRNALLKHSSSTGQSYLQFVDQSGAPEEEEERLPVMAKLADIETHFGVGNRLYFNFLLFSLLVNAVLSVIGIIQWSFYLSDPRRVLLRGQFEWKDFFMSEYIRPNQDKVWFVTSIVAACLMPLFSIMYFVWEKVLFHTRELFQVGKGFESFDI